MRIFQVFWRVFSISNPYNSPEFIEQLMTGLAIVTLAFYGQTPHHWQYLVLSSSYAIGAAASMWVRESILPTSRIHLSRVLAGLLLIYSLFCFSDLAAYL